MGGEGGRRGGEEDRRKGGKEERRRGGVVGTFCRLSHFINLMPNTLGKVCAFSEHVLDISWLHFDYILGSAGLYWASHQDSENIAHGYCFSYSLGVFVFVVVFVFVIVSVFVFVFLCHF